MADDDNDKGSKPMEPPKAVHIGGESLVDRILPHIKKILVTFILAAVAISVILVIRWRKHVGHENQTAKLVEVLAVARTPIKQPPPIPGLEMPDQGDTFDTPKARAEKILVEIARTGATPGGVFHAGALLDAGKVDEAIAEYRRTQNAKGIDGILAREGLGIALETKAGETQDATASQKLYEEALVAFDSMQPDETGPRRAHALYHQGRVHQALKRPDQAKALFEKAKTLAEAAEPTTKNPQIDERLLPQLIEDAARSHGVVRES